MMISKKRKRLAVVSGLLICGLLTVGNIPLLGDSSTQASRYDALTKLSDEFNKASTLQQWIRHDQTEGWPSQIDRLDIDKTHRGSLTLVPYTGTWYGDYRGVYLYKEVTGDFVVTSRLKVTGKKTDIPTGIYELAGLLVRAPKTITAETWEPNQENWLYLNFGTPDHTDHMVLDSKTVVNSGYTWEEIPAPTGWVQIKIARIGSAFFQFYKYDHQKKWTFLKRYDRPDLPDTLQVGMNAHGNTDKSFGMDPKTFNSTLFNGPEEHADLVAEFDYVRFQTPDVPESIKQKIINGKATDKQILHFLTE